LLTNDTGANVSMDNTSNLVIYMPQYFTEAQLQAMSITNISQAGWSFSYSSADMALLLSWQQDSSSWGTGDNLSFTIIGVQTTVSPRADSVQINFNNLAGTNVPSQVSSNLNLIAQPVPGNADLFQTLAVGTEYGGVVYVSVSVNPLTNTLYLNLKNIGSTPLYSGESIWSGTPKVTVSFVYGTTSGSLAPDDKQQSSQLGSAWAISGGIFVDQTGGWSVQNPSVSGQANSPSWTLSPISTNKQIIGTGDQSNVTFAFSNIVSLTPPGPTQMYVQFSGFMKDEHTIYNDRVFVVGITKQNPPNAGAIGIYCLDETIPVSSSTEQVSIPLTWSMFGVGSVKLSFYVPGLSIPEKTYSYGVAHPALNYDSQTPQITGIQNTQILTVYCWAYSDDNWQFLLNKIECTVPLIFPPVINDFSITTVDVAPPYSYAFRLDWDIAGQSSFEIIANDGSGSGTRLPVPQNVSTYVVNPTAPETTYTLNVYGNSTQE